MEGCNLKYSRLPVLTAEINDLTHMLLAVNAQRWSSKHDISTMIITIANTCNGEKVWFNESMHHNDHKSS